MDDSWDLETMPSMEDECLEFLRIVYIDFFLHKYTKICTYLMLFFHIPLWSIQYYYSLKTLDIHFVVQYGPLSLIFLFAFVSLTIPLIYENHLKICLDIKEQIFWTHSIATKKLQKKMLKIAKYFEYVAKLNLVLALIAYSLLLVRYRVKKDFEIIHQITLIKEHFPQHATILIVIFYVSMTYLVYSMTYAVYIMSYFTLQTLFQGWMINERVTKITENFDIDDIELVSNDSYQTQVAKRLRFCVIRFATLKSFVEDAISMVPALIVIYIILAMLLGICYLGAWYLIPDNYYPVTVAAAIVSAYSGLIAVEMGQLAETESLTPYNYLTDLPWYTFNVKNQKMLLFTLVHATTPLRISPYEAFPVNRRMIVQFYKVISSLAAFLANSKEKLVK